MHAYSSDRFTFPLPRGHRFPLAKYALLRERVARELPQVRIEDSTAAGDEELALAHSAGYIRRVSQGRLDAAELREIGLPWSAEMVERARRSTGATICACRAALKDGIAVNLAGGTHHASANQGAGYCLFNDVAVAARVIQGERRRPSGLDIAVVDLDVHQGNGTASIFKGDCGVFTFSMHAEKNFPFRKTAGDLDVGLADGIADDEYLAILATSLAAMTARFVPDLIIYLAGADVFEGDRLGRLKLSKDGIARRDRLVLDYAHARRIPSAIAMAGGYGKEIDDTVDIQRTTVSIALEYWRRWRRTAPAASAA